jgi:hypothetical protein
MMQENEIAELDVRNRTPDGDGPTGDFVAKDCTDLLFQVPGHQVAGANAARRGLDQDIAVVAQAGRRGIDNLELRGRYDDSLTHGSLES